MLHAELSRDEKYAHWKPPAPDDSEVPLKPESLQTEVTVDELVNNISGGWDEVAALQGVTKESAQKLLQEAYKAFDEVYENKNAEDNSARLDNLEKVIDLLRNKKNEQEQQGEAQMPKDNVIDRNQEFTQRTQMNDSLKGVRNLAFEMWGDHTALAQGKKILPEVQQALRDVRQKMQELKPGSPMNSDVAETLAVLRSGIRNRQKEKQARNPQADVELDAALAAVEDFIAEIKPVDVSKAFPSQEVPDSKIESVVA